jgi:hypothetical protein
MARCSICSNPETALMVNELRYSGTELKKIEELVGVGFRSVSRHCQPTAHCEFSFQRFKASKIKSRKTAGNARLVTEWPLDFNNQTFAYSAVLQDVDGKPFKVPLDKPEPGDIVLRCRFITYPPAPPAPVRSEPASIEPPGDAQVPPLPETVPD